jgi:peptidoglycan hydrolase CwlO-like protein
MTLVKPKVIAYSGRAMENREDREQRKVEAEKEQIRAEYQQVLKNSVAFEKRIRDRWREKNRQKNKRIAELEAKVEELERRLAEG